MAASSLSHWELIWVLVGNAVVDAFGAAQDRREELEMKRDAGRRGIAGRVNFDSPSEKNFATKHQAAMLLGLGREILMLMKMVLASVMVLCVLCFILIMKK
ncbi:Aldehyde dehydrogenase family 2 member B4, mitochondrial [Hordeum vulgare]|nr:Aldehyde dehydrogenase family 2 member B4, mitochondrial [Hordeum vulgare]